MSIFLKIKNKLLSIAPAHRQLTVFGVIHLIILGIWLNFSAFDIRIHPDVELYFTYATSMVSGNLPYRDFTAEYPPLALIFLLLPRLLFSTLEGYADGFAFLIIIFDIIGLVLVSRFSQILRLNHIKTLTIYTLAFFALGDIAINRFDVIPVIFTLGAVYFYATGKFKFSWFILGLGALTKLFPLALVPLFAIPYLIKRRYKPLLSGLAILIFTGLMLVIPSFIISPEGFMEFFEFHTTRGLQLESSYASLLMLANIFGITSIEAVQAFASVDIKSPAADFFVTASTYITIASLLACYWLFFQKNKRGGFNHDALISFSLGCIIFIIISSKVFSTQFIIWLYPLLPLLNNRMRSTGWIMFIAIAIMSCYIFPHNYGELVNLEQPAVAILIIRNTLVLALGILVILAGYRNRFEERLGVGINN